MRAVLRLGLLATFVSLGCGGTESTPPVDASTGDVTPDVVAIDASKDAAADATLDAAGDTSADAKDGGVVLPPGLLTPTPYVKKADSPFTGVSFPSYFHLEDFEDGLLNTVGVTSNVGQPSKPFGNLVDSVDGDDGLVDGKCGASCNSWFESTGSTGITFTFDAVALGALPTHVGVVWTDGGASCDVTFSAFDATNTLIGTKTLVMAGDALNTGEVAEDRFFGVVASGGIKSITVTNSTGGIEVDHLQYGR